ncbi:MAG TPA: hypothetical protein VM677_23465 [Actinokineospora sp.]|nr:hypothetical protein [Actinokineospora sp.]
MINIEDTDLAKALAMLAAKAPQVAAAIIREDLGIDQVDALLAILAETERFVRDLRLRWFGREIEDSDDSRSLPAADTLNGSGADDTSTDPTNAVQISRADVRPA